MPNIFETILGLFWPQKKVLIVPTPKAPEPEPPTPVTVTTVNPAPAPLANEPVKTSVAIKPDAFRKWRLTYYYVSDQSRFTGQPCNVPVYDKSGKELCRVEAGFFGEMSLQGTGRCRDGRLLNVSGVNVPVKHEDYAPVWARHQKIMAKRPPGYSGVVVKNDRVVAAGSYHWVDDHGVGFGTLRGKAHTPFKTVAADIGRMRRHEPKWMGKGGVCPLFTKVFIKQMVGKKCPNVDGTWFVHDGWFEVIDTGGGIFGKHFDIFAGTPAMAKQVGIPGVVDVWYDTIEERVPPDNKYSYGLYDK